MQKILLATVLVWFGWGVAHGAEETLTLEECRQFVESKSGVLLDARGAKYFAKTHIPGAINLPVNDFARAYEAVREKLRPDQRIVIYCSSLRCPDSAKLKGKLEKLGYTRVEVFKGGLAAWWKAGLPTETTAAR
jgi:rhodanese-related sulfurtransferase